MYKLASEFTDYIKEKYSPEIADKILERITEAIDSMFRADDTYSIPGFSYPAIMRQFHSEPGYSIDTLNKRLKRNITPYQETMYNDLETLLGSVGPKIRKIIEVYLQNRKPVIEPLGVIKHTNQKKETEPFPVTEPSPIRWQNLEDKLIQKLDESKSSKNSSDRYNYLLKLASTYSSVC